MVGVWLVHTGAALGSPVCGRVRSSVTCHLVRVFRNKNVGVDGCRLQGAGNKAKSTSIGWPFQKGPQFPLVVQGSRNGIRSLSTSAWPTVRLRFFLHQFRFTWVWHSRPEVWVKIVNTAIRLGGIFRIKERRQSLFFEISLVVWVKVQILANLWRTVDKLKRLVLFLNSRLVSQRFGSLKKIFLNVKKGPGALTKQKTLISLWRCPNSFLSLVGI